MSIWSLGMYALFLTKPLAHAHPFDRLGPTRAAANATPSEAEEEMATPPSDQVGTRVMFENDHIRVWDLQLEPGERLAKHIHKNDYFFIINSGSLIRFANPDDESDYRDVQFTDGQVTFVPVTGEGKIDNRLENIGTKRHWNYVIELKK
jgi:hypothetical protein